MVWYVVIGALAAFGLVSALWLILGWLIPGGKGWAAVCFREGAALERCLWLREWGLLRGPVLLLGEPDREAPTVVTGKKIEYCTAQELPARLEVERRNLDRTGTGDHSGHDQCRGISEL